MAPRWPKGTPKWPKMAQSRAKKVWFSQKGFRTYSHMGAMLPKVGGKMVPTLSTYAGAMIPGSGWDIHLMAWRPAGDPRATSEYRYSLMATHIGDVLPLVAHRAGAEGLCHQGGSAGRPTQPPASNVTR